MRLAGPAWKWPDPSLWAIAALLAAALLVVYLQRREVEALDRQTRLILEHTSRQAAESVVAEIRRSFEASVFETLAAVNHPLLRAGRFDLVAQEFAEGLAAYPHLDRFFLWHELTADVAPAEVLFFGGRPADAAHGALVAPAAPIEGFYRDPPFGRLVLDVARESATSQWIYAAAERRVGGSTYDLFVRIFWVDAARDRFFAVMGFVVNHQTVRGELFDVLYRRRLKALLAPRDGERGPSHELRILDDRGEVVFGRRDRPPEGAARAAFPLCFYPADEIRVRMASQVPVRLWQAIVTPAPGALAAVAPSGARGYWLSGVSVCLMVLALVFALRGRRRASQLSRMQAEFVAHVSHQLKTPLSLLSAVSETLDLERVRSPEKLAEYLRMMRTETHRLSGLVDRILEFSRVNDRRRAYELEEVDLTVLVRETVEAFDRALPGASIHVETEEGAVYVPADPAALEQVVVNLLDNAVKYSPREKSIVVAVRRTAAEAVLEVRDGGIGLLADERRRIFDRFYRGSGAALHRQGFGLGLAIVREIVAAHHGRVEVDSVHGRGTTFRVRLPLLTEGRP